MQCSIVWFICDIDIWCYTDLFGLLTDCLIRYSNVITVGIDLFSRPYACVVEMQNWLTRNSEVTVEVPASVVIEHHLLLQCHQVNCRTWDFNVLQYCQVICHTCDFSDDLSQTAGICITLNILHTVWCGVVFIIYYFTSMLNCWCTKQWICCSIIADSKLPLSFHTVPSQLSMSLTYSWIWCHSKINLHICIYLHLL